MRSIILIAHNLRSTHNVGSLLRTAEGLGVDKVYLTGYTPYPKQANDERLPHIAAKLHKQIEKTALGAEISQPWEYRADIEALLNELRGADYPLIAIEQTAERKALTDFHPKEKVALLVGREVEGVEPEVLEQMDACYEIPMLGQKESFNVTQAAAMALYHCRFVSAATTFENIA